jgi:uncharacterized protein (DUF302 family)
MNAYDTITVNAPPQTVVSVLRSALRARGLIEYAVVDHGRDMAAAGSPGFSAWTLILGNPAAGSKLLSRDLSAAIDIPLRLAVIASGSSQSAIVLRDMRSLLGEVELADAFTAVLRSLAEQARTEAETS